MRTNGISKEVIRWATVGNDVFEDNEGSPKACMETNEIGMVISRRICSAHDYSCEYGNSVNRSTTEGGRGSCLASNDDLTQERTNQSAQSGAKRATDVPSKHGPSTILYLTERDVRGKFDPYEGFLEKGNTVCRSEEICGRDI